MTKLEKLRRKLNNISKEVQKESNKEDKKKAKGLKQYVGQCFRYRNSYSSPSQESDYWWMYYKIISVDDYACFYMLMFQIDNSGNIEINTERHNHTMVLQNINYRPIKKEEWNFASKEFLNKITELGIK